MERPEENPFDTLPENPEKPPQVAADFARQFGLDLTYDSLREGFERWLPRKGDREAPLRWVDTVIDGQPFSYDWEVGASCYLGQVLAQRFRGEWKGHLSGRSTTDYYTSSVEFGDFRFMPFRYVGYRFANGVIDTGTVDDLLCELEPSLASRSNLKAQWIRREMGHGKVIVDGRPWI
jgi:hypothetical protein